MGFGPGVFFGWMLGLGMCAFCLLYKEGTIPEAAAWLWRWVRGKG